MANLPQIPVYSTFKINCPSVSVTISADDTPLPQGLGEVRSPASLVTINPGVAPVAETVSTIAVGDSVQGEGRPEEHDAPTVAPEPMHTAMYQRSSSRAANALYRGVSAILPMEEEVEETWAVMRDDTGRQEPHDFTYWDKLRRQHTKTEIRRWTSFLPETQQDTAFFGRNIEVDVPVAAYTQGIYYQRQPESVDVKEFKLPTESYVAPPVYIRRTKGICNGLFTCISCLDSRTL
ncbi:UNVERIFIED_CONTAM: hypothetical protein HHA_271930 [Hammondia hammondi]|eukprot:XP_008882538.1 hypothetical protein HHA_271930 [Hammondia hammondi]